MGTSRGEIQDGSQGERWLVGAFVWRFFILAGGIGGWVMVESMWQGSCHVQQKHFDLAFFETWREEYVGVRIGKFSG